MKTYFVRLDSIAITVNTNGTTETFEFKTKRQVDKKILQLIEQGYEFDSRGWAERNTIMTNTERRIKALPISTFAVAAVEWQKHECDSESDVCGCKFQFNCTKCGQPQTAFGESMPFLIGIGGLCEGCHYGARE